MTRYFLKRVLMMIPTLLAITLVVFVMLSLLPGSNVGEFSSRGDGDWLDNVFEKLDIHDTLISRYIRYIYGIITELEFGYYEPVRMDLGKYMMMRLKMTLFLALLGVVFSLIVGIPAGTAAAIYHNKPQDHIISFATMLLSSIPAFCLAILLVVIFSIWLGVLPVISGNGVESFVMPTLVVSAGGVALMTRMTRSAVLDVMNRQYITVLRAKGLSEGKIICRHVLKNALVPIVSAFNNLAAQILCGTLIVENFFNMSGIWQIVVRSIGERNQHAVLGCVIVISVLLMSVNIAADFICALINPQIREQYRLSSSGKGGAENAENA